MKLHAAVWASIAGLVVTAGAEARPDARSMTCKQLQVIIADQRVVVMDTGPHTYRRFVQHQGFCSVAEVMTNAWVEAGDGECQLKECRIRRSDDGN